MLSRKIVPLTVQTSKYMQIPRNFLWNTNQRVELDIQYLCDPNNFEEIAGNISTRKGIGNIQLVHDLKHKLEHLDDNNVLYETTKKEFYMELLKIPNRTHPDVVKYKNKPKIIKEIGAKRADETLKDFEEITKRLKLVRTDQLGNVCGSKSYYLMGEMAEFEHALIRYVVANLIKNKFELISVPDILNRDIIEGCGMNTRGTRTQVYTLDETLHGPDLCLSGTSEMALAGYLSNKTFSEQDLPLKLAAISRCYRAETSNLLEERGIYRVHEFSKVEMFIVSRPEESSNLLEEILGIQESIFQSLGLQFKVLDMPPHELGAQAYRKYDIEAWLAARKIYGEISSCSNCLDYQARRLGIKYKKSDGIDFVHTLNGTACAVPRLLIALMENGQNKKGSVNIPEVLHKYMRGKEIIGKQNSQSVVKLVEEYKTTVIFMS